MEAAGSYLGSVASYLDWGLWLVGQCRSVHVITNMWRHYLLTCAQLLRNTIEPSPSREADSSSTSQDISRNYGTRRFITAFTTAHHLSLSRATLFHSSPFHETFFPLSSHLHLKFQSSLFPSGFFTKILCAFLFSPTHVTLNLITCDDVITVLDRQFVNNTTGCYLTSTPQGCSKSFSVFKWSRSQMSAHASTILTTFLLVFVSG